MKVDIVSESDDQFKIKVKQFGTVAVATDGERTAIGTTEELAVQAVEEMQELTQRATGNAKQPAPLENRQGLGWFDGTSWGNN